MSPDLRRRLVAHLDLTDLRPRLDDAALERLVERGATRFGPVAGLCVHASNAATVRHLLDAARLSTRLVVIAGFPDGSQNPDAVLTELRVACDDGADEIDLLYPAALQGDRSGLDLVERAAGATRVLKVILESSAWDDPVALLATARSVFAAGAAMIKTGSGSTTVPPFRITDAELLTEAAAETPSGGIKVSGGVTLELATRSLALARRRLGEAVDASRFRIGASRLLDELEEGAVADGSY